MPFANLYLDEPNMLTEVGVEGTKGLMNITHFEKAGPQLNSPGYIKYYQVWNNQWKNKWKTAPYNSPLFEHGRGRSAPGHSRSTGSSA